MARTFQNNFNGGILGPGMYSRTDVSKYNSGVKDAVNVLVLPQGGLQSRAGTRIAGGYDTSTVDGHQWLIPFQADAETTYQLEFSDNVMRVIKDGAYVLDSGVGSETVVGVTSANPAQLDMGTSGAASSFTVGRLVYLKDPNGSSVLHQQVLEVTAISGQYITFKIVGGTTIDTTSGSWGTIGSGATLEGVYQLTSPFAIEDMPDVDVTQDVDTLYFASRSYDPRSLTRTADDNWAFATLTFEPEIDAPTGVSATATTGSGSETYKYKVSAIAQDSGEESLPSSEVSCTNDLTTSGNENTVSWTGVTGASVYLVYKETNGIFGYIGTTEGTSFVDNNIAADATDNPQNPRDPFATASDRPDVVTFIEQRLTFASTANNPQGVEMSNSKSPLNFNRALTPVDSDAITFRMRSQSLNRVVAVVPSDPPLVLTAGAEWTLQGGDDKGYLTPSNPILRPKAYRGSAQRPRPLSVGNGILHVMRDGRTIREFILDRAQEPSAEVSLLARHLFAGKTVVSWAYAQAPDSVVWVVLDDGTLLSFTYMVEHEIWAWTKHQLGGTDVKVKQVSVVTEGAFDVPYFVVERTLYGGTVTLVERLDTRQFDDVTGAYFVDCGASYSGSDASSLRGYLHLRGENVAVLADGNVLEDISVDDYGTVAISPAAGEVHVGLSYEASFTTLGIDFGMINEIGSSQGRFKAASEVAVEVVDTRGIAVGREGGELNEVKEFTGADPIPLATTIHLVAIDGDWVRDAAITIKQQYPLPMTVTSVAPEWELGL